MKLGGGKKQVQIFRSLDTDTDLEGMESGSYPHALNVEEAPVDEGRFLAKRKAKGNRAVDVSSIYVSGRYKLIGSAEDIENNAVIHFAWHSGGDHVIFRQMVDDSVQLVLRNSVLNFQEHKRIRKAHVIDNLLYWTDRHNPPRKINLDKAVLHSAGTGGYSSIVDELLWVRKNPPYEQVYYEWAEDSSFDQNLLVGQLWKFSYRYVYDDGEKSTWAPYSKVALSPFDGILPGGSQEESTYNQIDLKINTGPYYVEKIEIAATNEDTQQLYLIEVLDKYDESGTSVIASDVEYTYPFKDTGYKVVLADEDVNQLFHAVPDLAGQQEVVDENTLVYGDIEENQLEFKGHDVTLTGVKKFQGYNKATLASPDFGHGFCYVNIMSGNPSHLRPTDYVFYRIDLSSVTLGVEKVWVIELSVGTGSSVPTTVVSFYQSSTDSLADVNQKMRNAFQTAVTPSLQDQLDDEAPYFVPQKAIAHNGGFDQWAFDPNMFDGNTGGFEPDPATKVPNQLNDPDGTNYITNDFHRYSNGTFQGSGYSGHVDDPITSNYDNNYVYVLRFVRTMADDSASSAHGGNTVLSTDEYLWPSKVITYDLLSLTQGGSLKEGASYAVAVAYYWPGLVTNGPVEVGRILVDRNPKNFQNEDDGVVHGLRYEINHAPPSGAISWSVLVSERLNFSLVKQFYVRKADIDIQDTRVTIKLEEEVLNRFGENVTGYDYVAGDMLCFVRYTNDSGHIKSFSSKRSYLIANKTYNDQDEANEYSVSVDPVVAQEISDSATESLLVEIVRFKDEAQDIVWKEVGELNPIINGYHVHKFSDGTTTDQSSGVVGQKDLYIADVYRRIVATPAGTVLCEDDEFSDYFKSGLSDYGRGMPYAPIKKTDRKALLRASQKFFDNTEVNGLSAFLSSDYKNLEERYGRVIGMEYLGSTLRVIQERKITSIYVRRLETTDGNGDGKLVVTSKVFGTARYSSSSAGSQHPYSIVTNGRHIFFLDSINGIFYRDDQNGPTPVSVDAKTSSLFRQWSQKIQSDPSCEVVSGFDWSSMKVFVSMYKPIAPGLGTVTQIVDSTTINVQVTMNNQTVSEWLISSPYMFVQSVQGNREVYLATLQSYTSPGTPFIDTRVLTLTVPDSSEFVVNDIVPRFKMPVDAVTISYSEMDNKFKSFHSFVPDVYSRLNDNLISSVFGIPYVHDDAVNRARYYGQQFGFELDAVFNFNSEFGLNRNKTFSVLSMTSNASPDVDPVTVYSAGQKTMESRLKPGKFKKEGPARAAGFLRNVYNSGPGETILTGKRLKGGVVVCRVNNDGPSEFQVLDASCIAVVDQLP